MAGLKLEIVQEPPFSSVEEEAFLNLLRTADCLQRAFHLHTREWGLTLSLIHICSASTRPIANPARSTS